MLLLLRRGFTLVELLVVIAIIGVLAGLLMPVISNAMVNANKAADLNNLAQIGKAAMLYAQNYKSKCFPHYGDGSNGIKGDNDQDGALICLSLLVREKHLTDTEMFLSPAGVMVKAEPPNFDDKDELKEWTLAAYNTNYGWRKKYYSMGGGSAVSKPLSCTAYVSVDSESEIEGGEDVNPYQCFSDGVNVLYTDSHVSWVSLTNEEGKAELEKVIKEVVVSEGLESYVGQ